MTPPIKHYLQFADFSADEYAYLLARAARPPETVAPVHAGAPIAENAP